MSDVDLSEEDLAQMWAGVFRARAILNEAPLGERLEHADLLRALEDVLSVVERLRSSYDAHYAHLWQARDLLGELTGAEPIDHPDHGQEWPRMSPDLVRRARQFLRSTEPKRQI